jgi:hypothetical protein
MKLLAIVVPVIVVAVLLILLWYLYDVAPASYSEHKTVMLTFEQNPAWRASICIPGTNSGQPDWTTVSFNWTSGTAQIVTLVVWQHPLSPDQSVYNRTATSGSGFYSSQGTEEFAAFAAPSPSTVVTIQLSYTLPGHQWGGPIAGPTC